MLSGPAALDYDTVDLLRRNHPAWRLLRADHAALVVSFLQRTFVAPNVRTLPQAELVSRLEYHLHDLRGRLGDGEFPRRAAEYLDAWAGDECGWLRKYYPPDGDEPYFDLTPSAEKGIEWAVALLQRQFVATESRLLMVFELLRQIVEGTERDRAARLGELAKRRAQIDAEMRRIEGGDLELMDDAQVKDRFLQIEATARALLSDFREVEQNFRKLDREVRERIAFWEGAKGGLLEQVFGDRDAISDSDQGRSFRAFWDFLMSPTRQEELTQLLGRVFALEPVRAMTPDPRLMRVHYDWLEAGEVTQRTVARLSEQLRRYLDDRVFLENRRIVRIIREIEQRALAVRDDPPTGVFAEIDEIGAAIDLPMDRPLFALPLRRVLDTRAVAEADQQVSAETLFEQVFVDREKLMAQVRRALQARDQISLAELLAAHPLEEGLAELIAYLGLAAEGRHHFIHDREQQVVSWTDRTGVARQATVPLVVFHR